MSDPSPRRLQGYLAGRTVVLAALLVLAIAFQARQPGFPAPLAWFFALTAGAFGFTLASALAVRGGRVPPAWFPLQPGWDVAYTTGLVLVSGGAFSPFATLYTLAIIGSAILLYRRGALAVATASALSYGVLVDLQFYGLLRPLNPFPLPATTGANVLTQLGFNLLAFYAVAFLSGYLAEELRRTGARLEEAEAEVLDLEHLKESILQSLGSGLVAVDARGRSVLFNRAAEELLGRAGHRLALGTDVSALFDLRAGPRNEVPLAGGELVLGYSVAPLFDRKGRPRGSILIFQDLTEVKRLEAELRRADRLAAVGRLAAGLAHEIRNPLGSLSGSVEMLRQGLGTEDDGRALFEIVLRETARLNRLVTNFLHYARPGPAEKAEVPLRDLVDEVGFFFAHGEGSDGFRLVNRVPEGWTLNADRSQLEQLLLNLFRNSREAAPGGVTVTVEAGAGPDGLVLRVRDDGPGMAREVAERVFEPFFTRKPGGTGLGLATVHRIVENHGGDATLTTEPGRGVEFRFRFPAPARAPARRHTDG